jgi:hypothetical protein
MRDLRGLLRSLSAVCLLALGTELPAQCTLPWQTGSGANGAVFAALPLPNGDLVLGGDFTSIGGTAANRIARRSGGTWQAR